MLVWALAIGFLVWGDIPTPALLIGSGIVVGSGLFLLLHESMRQQAWPKTAPPPGQPIGKGAAGLGGAPGEP
jgi:hypothetical protein